MDYRCPGQETRRWKPEDVFEALCPVCGASVEFFKDDVRRECPACGNVCPNPRINLGCLEWCKDAEACRALLERRQRQTR